MRTIILPNTWKLILVRGGHTQNHTLFMYGKSTVHEQMCNISAIFKFLGVIVIYLLLIGTITTVVRVLGVD